MSQEQYGVQFYGDDFSGSAELNATTLINAKREATRLSKSSEWSDCEWDLGIYNHSEGRVVCEKVNGVWEDVDHSDW